jgi:hypothetical protein
MKRSWEQLFFRFSDFVSKSDLNKRTYYIASSIPEQVRLIPVLENPEGLFMAGEALDQIWSNFCRGKGTPHTRLFPEVPSSGTPCPAYGCSRCDNYDCIYGDFIRHYWNHPVGD